MPTPSFSFARIAYNNADIRYCANFLTHLQQKKLFERLQKSIYWQQHHIVVFGKKHPQPRLSYWMSDANVHYRYSQLTLDSNPWCHDILMIKQQLEKVLHTSFNGVLCNYYRHGKDSMGWHADNEPTLGKKPIIASLSLGGSRDFQWLQITDKKTHTFSLHPGSVLVMQGDTQQYYQHQIPKRANSAARINLTFRYLSPYV